MPRLTLPSARRWAVAALLGGVGAFLGDHLHVVGRVLDYPHPVFLDQAWWVCPLFVAATLALLSGARLIHPSRQGRGGSVLRAAAADSIAFFTAYAFTAFGHTLPDVVLWVLVGAWAARVVRDLQPRLILFSVLVAIAGTSWEAMWSAIGMFSYRHPDLLGVPRWLPALYLHAAVAVDSARCVVDGEHAFRA